MPSTPDPHTRARAEKALAMATADLGLDPAPRIVWREQSWFGPASGPGLAIMGRVSSSTPEIVNLSAELPLDRAAETAAHECRHLHQYRKGWYRRHRDPKVKAAGEWDARWYGETMAEKVEAALASDAVLAELKSINAMIESKKGCGCAGKAAQSETGWLTDIVNGMRRNYERDVCSNPTLATRTPFCASRPVF